VRRAAVLLADLSILWLIALSWLLLVVFLKVRRRDD